MAHDQLRFRHFTLNIEIQFLAKVFIMYRLLPPNIQMFDPQVLKIPIINTKDLFRKMSHNEIKPLQFCIIFRH